jgi:hypothetical protein
MLSGALLKDGAIENPNGDTTMSATPENFTVWAEIPVTDMEIDGEPFRSERGKTLADFYRAMESEAR